MRVRRGQSAVAHNHTKMNESQGWEHNMLLQ